MKTEKSEESRHLILKVSGPIDEDSIFPQVSAPVGGDVVVDLDKVTIINSCGVREWVRWIAPLAATAPVVLRSCPKSIIDQANTVEGFLPKGVKVESFYVSYYCDKCGASMAIPFQTDNVASNRKKAIPVEIVCTHCKKAGAEIDVVPQKYFLFLENAG